MTTRITIYLDEDSDARLKAAVRDEGISVNEWVARLIEEKTRREWPVSVRALAGLWSADSLPVAGLREVGAADIPRETL